MQGRWAREPPFESYSDLSLGWESLKYVCGAAHEGAASAAEEIAASVL